MKKKSILKHVVLMLIIIAIQAINVTAQDIHFSQFYHSPLLLNPAKTGDACNFRMGVNYRNQWASVTSPYKTIAAYFDFPIFLNYRKTSSLGFGLSFYNDVAGDGNLTTFEVAPAIALHIGFDRSNRYKLSLGAAYTYRQKKVDLNKLTWATTWNGTSLDPTLPNGEYSLRGNIAAMSDVNAGFQFRAAPSDIWGISVGYAKYHVTEPNETFQANPLNLLNTRDVGHLGLRFQVTDKLSILPNFLYYFQQKATEYNVGSEFNYKLNPDVINGFAVFAGPYYRFGDALQILVGGEVKGWRLGVTYDVNLSKLREASKLKGGFEMAIMYRAPCKPLPYRKKYMFACPRF